MTRSDSSNSRRIVFIVILMAIASAVCHRVVLNPDQVLYGDHSDILAQHYPMRFLLADGVKNSGTVPLWNRSAFCGMPLLGDPQSGLFYAPNWLHLIGDVELWFGWSVLIHMWIAGIGTFLWMRRFSDSTIAQFTGAIVVMLSGKWLVHMVHPGHIVFAPVALLPWILLIVDRLASGPRAWHAAILALLSASLYFGAHPQLTFFGALFVCLYALVHLGTCQARSQFLMYLCMGGILALGLTMIQFLPNLELAAESLRGGGLTYKLASRKSLLWNQMVWFLMPRSVPALDWELQPFLGVTPLCLVIFSMSGRQRNQAWFFLLLLALSVMYALGNNGFVHQFFYDWIPGFRYFRLPIRILLLAPLSLAALTVMGMNSLSDEQADKSKPTWILATASCIVGIGVLASWRSMDSLIPSLIFILPLVSLTTLRARVNCALLFSIVCIAEMSWFAAPLIDVRSLDSALGSNPIVDSLATADVGRVYSVGDQYPTDDPIPPGYSTPHQLEMTRGFNPLVPSRTARFLREGIGREEGFKSGIEVVPNYAISNRFLFDMLGVSHIASPRPVQERGIVEQNRYKNLSIYHYARRGGGRTTMPEVVLYENHDAFPRAFFVDSVVSCDTEEKSFAQLTSLTELRDVPIEGKVDVSPSRQAAQVLSTELRVNETLVRVEATGGGFLVISEIWFPGWKATVDGNDAPVIRVGGTFCGVEIPPGTNRVNLRYMPDSFLIGIAISSLSLLISLCAMASLLRPAPPVLDTVEAQ